MVLLLAIIGVPVRESNLVVGGTGHPTEVTSSPTKRLSRAKKSDTQQAEQSPEPKRAPQRQRKEKKQSSGKSVHFAEDRSVRVFDRKTRETVKNYKESATTKNTDPTLA